MKVDRLTLLNEELKEVNYFSIEKAAACYMRHSKTSLFMKEIKFVNLRSTGSG